MTVNTFGSFQTERSDRTVAGWLWPFIPISLSAFSLSALVYYHLHHGMELQSPLQLLYARIYQTFGLAPAVMFFTLTLTWSSIWFATGTIDRPLARLLRLFAMAVMLGIFINLGTDGVVADVHKGTLGAWLAGVLSSAFGPLPSLVVVWAVTFASFVLATDFFFSERFERLRQAAPPVGEAGVEPAVAEHLRALAGEVASLPPLAPPAAAAAVPAPAPVVDEPPAAPAVEPDEPIVVLRRSYADRAAERAARREAAGLAAAAMPAAQDVPVAEPEAAEPAEDVSALASAPVDEPVDGGAADAPAASTEERAPVAEADEPAPMAPWQLADGEPPAAVVDEPPPAVAAWEPAAADAAAAAPVEPPVDVAAASEPVVAIPRPEPRADEPARQQSLFGSGLDEVLLQDAVDVVSRSGRATAALLQRKLRIDYVLACDVLATLAARGVISLDGEAGGRVNS